jgi:hypothetical protein
MHQTMANATNRSQIVSATFSNRARAEQAVDALQELGISPLDLQVVVQLSTKAAKDVYTDILSDRGFSVAQARYYDELIRNGKVLVAVYDVVDPGPVIDILDECHAEFNPDGSRNLRDDVLGVTTGTAVGSGADYRK